MGYWRQFEYFDPLKGQFPSWPFPQGQSIVYRARSILHGRTSEQIREIASDADRIIEQYFDHEKESVLDAIKADGRYDLLEGDEDRITGFKDEAAEHYDVRTSENTSDLDALQEAMDSFFDPTCVEVENPLEYEYFAVLALWLIGECVDDLENKFDFTKMERVKRTDRQIDAHDTARMARHLLDAMEAVCYAERLRDVERTQNKYEAQIEKIRAKHVALSDEEATRVRAEVLREVAEEARARRVEQSKENNRIRHQGNHDVKKLVLEMWEQNPTQFPSAEKAGAHYVEVLSQRGIDREHRTVVGWIRARAKELGIRFR